MIDVVCFKWTPSPGYRSSYGPETVNVLYRMVSRHYRKPFRFTCVTDNATGIDPAVRVLPLWGDFAKLPSPHGGKNPSCYRRLKLFAPEAAEIIGPRFIAIDLDTVITGDLSSIFDRTEEFVAYGDTNPKTHYNGSLMLMTAGTRRRVWDEFDPSQSPREAKQAGCFGSDQGWISLCLGPGEAKFGKRDGVYSYRNDLRTELRLPENTRIVVFHGELDPWHPRAKKIDWVERHYQ